MRHFFSGTYIAKENHIDTDRQTLTLRHLGNFIEGLQWPKVSLKRSCLTLL